MKSLFATLSLLLLVSPRPSAALDVSFKGGARDMTVRQVVEMREARSLSWSPDGSLLAFVERQAVLSMDEWQSILYVVPIVGGEPRALVRGGRISASIHWSADSQSLIYLSKSEGVYQAWSVAVDGGAPRQLTHHPAGVGAGLADERFDRESIFRLSPDGKRAVFYTRDRAAAEAQLKAAWRGGIQYTERHRVGDLNSEAFAWKRMPAAVPSVWLLDLGTGQEREIWRAPATALQVGTKPMWFDWSPNGKYLALSWRDNRDSRSERCPLILFSTDTFDAQDLLPTLGETNEFAWSRDGRSITFRSVGESSQARQAWKISAYRYSLDDRVLVQIDGEHRRSSVEINHVIKVATGESVHSCAKNRHASQAACIREDSTTPPDIVLYALTKRGIWGRGRPLTKLNPNLTDVELGKVFSIRGRPEDGVDSGVILPVRYEPGKRYPLVVMQYNLYDPGRFSGKVHFTSYAPQVLAANGFVVLIQNLPSTWTNTINGDFSGNLAREAEAVALSLRAMLDELIERGIVDPKRMGLMGWSFGGFLTPYIQTHYPDWFRAAAMGEGGNHQPTFYWLTDDTWREMEDRYFGEGGPTGTHKDRWRAVAPIFNVDKLRAPLLLEYSQAYLGGLELYRTIIDHGGQAELHVYPTEAHVLERPSNQYASIQRHIDWFSFWLQDKEAADSDRKEQYGRWRALRAKREMRTSTVSPMRQGRVLTGPQ